MFLNHFLLTSSMSFDDLNTSCLVITHACHHATPVCKAVCELMQILSPAFLSTYYTSSSFDDRFYASSWLSFYHSHDYNREQCLLKDLDYDGYVLDLVSTFYSILVPMIRLLKLHLRHGGYTKNNARMLINEVHLRANLVYNFIL
jgi:hypothetical protein